MIVLDNNIFQTLNKLKGKQQPRKEAKYIYQDEQTGQIKERPLSAAASGKNYLYKNPAKLIHDSMFDN